MTTNTAGLVLEMQHETDPNSPWIETFSGESFHFMIPSPDEVHISDIAQSLSKVCRFSGHCTRFYSVAEHSGIIADWLYEQTGDKALALQALLHDASETYLVDVPRPIKPFLTNYYEIEGRVMVAIFQRFGLPEKLDNRIKEADARILVDERRDVMSESGRVWQTDTLEPLGTKIVGLLPDQALEFFGERFNKYSSQ